MVFVGAVEKVTFGFVASALFSILAAQPATAEMSPKESSLKHRPAPTQGAACADHSTPAGVDRYCVSSVLSRDLSVNAFPYGPASLFDDKLNTAWVEGMDGQGIGEWLVVEFDGPRMVKEILINNGYNKDNDLYQKNSRVKGIKVEFSEREKRSITLKDIGATQPIVLPKDQSLKAYWVKFTIESVYP